jgi:hypothetical protein
MCTHPGKKLYVAFVDDISLGTDIHKNQPQLQSSTFEIVEDPPSPTLRPHSQPPPPHSQPPPSHSQHAQLNYTVTKKQKHHTKAKKAVEKALEIKARMEWYALRQKRLLSKYKEHLQLAQKYLEDEQGKPHIDSQGEEEENEDNLLKYLYLRLDGRVFF